MLKTKFNELSSTPSAIETINFWKILPPDYFSNLRRFAQGYIPQFGNTFRCEQVFSYMKMIKSKQRSRLTDSNLNNLLKFATTNLNPNILRLVKSKQHQKSH